MGEQTGIVEEAANQQQDSPRKNLGDSCPRGGSAWSSSGRYRGHPLRLAATGDEPAIAVYLRQAMEKTDAENPGFIPTACPSIVAALERGQEGFLAALARVVIEGRAMGLRPIGVTHLTFTRRVAS